MSKESQDSGEQKSLTKETSKRRRHTVEMHASAIVASGLEMRLYWEFPWVP